MYKTPQHPGIKGANKMSIEIEKVDQYTVVAKKDAVTGDYDIISFTSDELKQLLKFERIDSSMKIWKA